MLLPQQPVFLWLVRLGSAEVVHQFFWALRLVRVTHWYSHQSSL